MHSVHSRPREDTAHACTHHERLISLPTHVARAALKKQRLSKGQLGRVGARDRKRVLKKARHVYTSTFYELFNYVSHAIRPLRWRARLRLEYRSNLDGY